MKQGKTVNNDIITLNKNVITIQSAIEPGCIAKIEFDTNQQANEYFKRFNISKPRGRKKERKSPQARVYYSQLIIQM